MHERLGERGFLRAQREAVEDLTVNDLLDLYVLDYEAKGQGIQIGRVVTSRAATAVPSRVSLHDADDPAP